MPIEASGVHINSGTGGCCQPADPEEQLQSGHAAAVPGAMAAPIHSSAHEALPYAKSQNSHFRGTPSQIAGEQQQQQVLPFPYCASGQGAASAAPHLLGPGLLLVKGSSFRTRPA